MTDLRYAPQPGGRAPAPGQLALVQAFLNTHYDLAGETGGEVLQSADVLRSWLVDASLSTDPPRLSAADLRRALDVREGLRALAFANNDRPLDQAAVGRLRRASAGAHAEIAIEPDGPRFAPAEGAGLDGALGLLFAITATAMLQDTWPRVKACPGRDCGWVFYDHSRNQSARWCAMKVCGDREKARAYYARRTRRT